MSTSTTGRFVWHELHTSDRPKATKFYKTLLEVWETKDGDAATPPGEEPYTHVMLGGHDFAGIIKSKAPAHVPPHWLPYLAVDDVDASAKKAKELGGKVLNEPMSIPNVGRFAVIADPQGAAFAIYKHGSHGHAPEHDTFPIGAFCWDELLTSDPEAAVKFYSGLFGYTVESHDMGPMGTYRLLKRGDRHAGGVMKLPPNVPHASWLAYIHVSDVDQSTRNAKELGAKVMMEPMDLPNIGRSSIIVDPTGAAVALFKGKM